MHYCVNNAYNYILNHFVGIFRILINLHGMSPKVFYLTALLHASRAIDTFTYRAIVQCSVLF